MYIAVCDDEALFIEQIVALIKEQPQYDKFMQIDTYLSGEALLQAVQQGQKYDVLFLDILMDGMDGIGVVEALQGQDYIIVLVSSSHDYVAKAFHLNVDQYLFKPVRGSDFAETFDRCVEMHRCNQKLLSVTINHVECQLLLKDIMYFESQKRKVVAVDRTGETYAFYGKLDELEKQFAQWKLPNLLRVHKSYIVNLDYCKGLEKLEILLRGDGDVVQSVQISTRRATEIKKIIKRYMLLNN